MSKYQFLILFINLVVSLGDWNLIWSDHFEQQFDYDRWDVEHEFHENGLLSSKKFSSKNKSPSLRVVNEYLVITALDDSVEQKITITTKNGLNYGKIEIRAAIPEVYPFSMAFYLSTMQGAIAINWYTPHGISQEETDFHLYTIELNQANMGSEQMKLNLRLAVSGTSYEMTNRTCTSLIIDYVKYYQYSDTNLLKNNSKQTFNETKKSLSSNQICNNISKWNLVWSDEFDGKQIDLVKWNVDPQNNLDNVPLSETQSDIKDYFVNSIRNTGISDGMLITSVNQRHNSFNEFISGYIVSEMLFSFGKLDIRAAMPQGHSIWAAIYMKSTMENDLRSIYINLKIKNSTYHIIEYLKKQSNIQHDNMSGFHVYTLEWNSTKLILKIDGTTTLSKSFNGYEKIDLYTLHLKLGVNPGNFKNKTTESHDWSCPSMFVDYIRYYKWSDQLITTKEIETNSKISINELCEKRPKWKLAWGDEFSNDESLNNWSKIEIPCRDRVCFTNLSKNLRIVNGAIILSVLQEINPKQFTSSWIHSKEHFSYGKITIRAAMPQGSDLASFIYLTPEFKIAIENESTIYLHQFSDIKGITSPDTIILKISDPNDYPNYGFPIREQNLNDFNIYSIEWNETDIIFEINSKLILWYDLSQIKTNKLHSLKLNFKVDINALPHPNGTKTDDWFCPSLIIDYVRYYQLSYEEFAPENNQETSSSRDSICIKLNQLKGNANQVSNSSNLTWIIPITCLIVILIIVILLMIYKLKRNEIKPQIEAQNKQKITDIHIYDEPEHYHEQYEELNYEDSPVYLQIYESVQHNPDYVDMSKNTNNK